MEENSSRRRLWYRQPASVWEEALPVGNGRIGAMVYGGAAVERLQLNEDTLWSGFPRDKVNYESIRYLDRVRELIRSGKVPEAQQTIERHMQGENTEAYMPLGDLSIELQDMGEVSDYKRELCLEEAVARSEFQAGGAAYKRECFVSAPEQTLVYRCESDGEYGINALISLGSPLRHRVIAGQDGKLALFGDSPSHVADNYRGDHPKSVLYEEGLGLTYEIHLQVITEGGYVTPDSQGRLRIKDASSFTILLTAATNFRAYDSIPDPADELPSLKCGYWLERARLTGFWQQRKTHVEDYRRLFGRVDFKLESILPADIPTDERLQRYRSGEADLGLEELYFHYGRYLLISSSRPGTQPANLQGIWNPHVQPPWNSNYTANINIQMNYWPAEVCQLSECHKPLLRMIEELSATGSRTANIHYGCRGWTAHHNVDLWRMSGPAAGDASWAFWPMGGAWLCRHLWEHYLFTGDDAFLRKRAYPIMRGAALFCLDWLTEGPEGKLVTSPSTSPENKFVTPDGRICSISMASTMDIAIIRELFQNVIDAAKQIDFDYELQDELSEALERLPEYRIGKYGGIQEWIHDYEEHEPGHRHVSHLYGLYPGDQINERTPELLEAARVTLRRRLEHGGGHTGWSCAWLINLFARLKDGEQGYRYVRTLLAKSTLKNLLDDHPPFQIDGNFGGTAGIVELLLQSHLDGIELLPALPSAWAHGEVRGLRARGGFTIDMRWEQGQLRQAQIYADRGGFCRIRYAEPIRISLPGGEEVEYSEGGFEAAAGKTYVISRANI
ncbi:glycoside hydrolase N-terminal domain-containing protein [Paenibacillus tarimensis]